MSSNKTEQTILQSKQEIMGLEFCEDFEVSLHELSKEARHALHKKHFEHALAKPQYPSLNTNLVAYVGR